MAARKPPAGRSVGGNGERVVSAPLAANPFASPDDGPPVPDILDPAPVVHTIKLRDDRPVFRAYGHVLTERGWEKE